MGKVMDMLYDYDVDDYVIDDENVDDEEYEPAFYGYDNQDMYDYVDYYGDDDWRDDTNE